MMCRLPVSTIGGLLVAALILASLPASAATLFGIVSDRTAPAVANATHAVLANQGKDKILLRTQSQVLAADDKTLDRWLNNADAVMAIAVYGEAAQRLQLRLDRAGNGHIRNFIALNGESGLSMRSRFDGEPVSRFPQAAALTLTQNNLAADIADAARKHPTAAQWLALHDLWQAGGPENLSAFLRYWLHPRGTPPAPRPQSPMQFRMAGKDISPAALHLNAAPVLVVLDLNTSDPQPADAICQDSTRRKLQCLVLMARWGESSRDAIAQLKTLVAPASPAGLVVLQDFVVGAAEGREAVTSLLSQLDVPVYKAIRLTDRSASAWQLSEDGLPINSVQYRVAMPEIQGSSQPTVVAAAGPATLDKQTGVELKLPQMLPAEISALVTRAIRWHALRDKPNADKKVALIYYNHPPGRQNIGADNLDVPPPCLTCCMRCKKPATPPASCQLRPRRCSTSCSNAGLICRKITVPWPTCSSMSPIWMRQATSAGLPRYPPPYAMRWSKGRSASSMPT